MFYRPWQTVRPDPARSAALSAALGLPLDDTLKKM